MLKAIRLTLSQQMPNYRKPASFLIKESYPLPPYSSIIGMICTACGAKQNGYIDMKLSIQGEYASEVSDFATTYNFGIKYEESRHQLKAMNDEGGYDGINRTPKSTHLLTDVKLVIHILTTNDEDFDRVLQGLKCPQNYMSLGRHEDIVCVEAVDEVELLEEDERDDSEFFKFKYDAYVPVTNENEKSSGTIYKLTKKYSIDKKTNIRKWDEIVKVYHMSKGTEYIGEDFYLDAELNTPVCFA